MNNDLFTAICKNIISVIIIILVLIVSYYKKDDTVEASDIYLATAILIIYIKLMFSWR